jgi:hypothetical protein
MGCASSGVPVGAGYSLDPADATGGAYLVGSVPSPSNSWLLIFNQTLASPGEGTIICAY